MNTSSKKILIVVVIILGLLIAGVAGYFAWNAIQGRVAPVETPADSEKASQAKQAGVKAEANGENEKALESYQAALDAYRKAGDKAAAEDMSFKVEFIKKAIAADKKATQEAIKNGDAPYTE
ncbi:MAG TPA: hypothetical protein VGE34_02225 [Candidatus Saccharimonadales bacterium]